jgi:hypothetical protein
MDNIGEHLRQLEQQLKQQAEDIKQLKKEIRELQEKRVAFEKPDKRTIFFYLHKDLQIEKQKAIDITQDFHLYYEANGWFVGRVKMKDWKSAEQKWLIKNKNNSKNLFNGKNHQSDPGRKPVPTGTITPGGFKGL